MARRPEVLAPAGDRDALEAAVLSGADAVYLGLSSFNARARATNFTEDDLVSAVRFAHERGTKVYVALNTLVFEHELPAVVAAISAVARAGADAIIVQDPAVALLAKAVAPTLAVHASTQMTCTDASSVRFAEELGAVRVVLARELSIDDVRAISEGTRAELEVFVHGALCVAYSGQCLTSEAIGGRSANRGACAQACRLPYDLVVDGDVRPLGGMAYLLSPEDLEASALVPELASAGVRSLKIEGRLKGPEYVASTTRLYKKAALASVGDAPPPGDEDRAVALQAYTRGSGPGFLKGTDHQRLVDGKTCDHRGLFLGTVGPTPSRPGARRTVDVQLEAPLRRGDGVLFEGKKAGEGEVGGRVWSIFRGGVDVEVAEPSERVSVWLGPDKTFVPPEPGGRVWKTSDPVAAAEARKAFEREPARLGFSVTVSGNHGELPTFTARVASGLEVSVQGDLPLAPAERPLAEAVVRDKLGKLKDTPFFLDAIELRVPERTLVPPSSMNRARRALVDELTRALGSRAHVVHDVDLGAFGAVALPPAVPPGLFVLARDLPQARAAFLAGATGVYLDFLELQGVGVALRALRAEGHELVGVAPPRIRKPGEEKIDRYLASLEPSVTLVRGLGALHDGPLDTSLRIGDFSLNVTNAVTARYLLSRGLRAFTPSFDSDAAQVVSLLRGDLAARAEVVVHHPMPLFHTEHCVFAHLLSEGRDHRTCGRPCERHAVALRDRAGMTHPVIADVGCRNTVFHERSQSAADIVPTLVKQGVGRFRIELVRETPDDVRRVVSAYRELVAGTLSPPEVVRALRTEAGYGVVRGSLRVLASQS